MNIESLQSFTYKKVREVEERQLFDPKLNTAEQLKRKYNTVRTLDDYQIKFPELCYFLRDGIELLEIGVGEGKAFKEIKQLFNVYATATNLQENKDENYLEAPACDLPFQENCFDVVIAIHSITWEPNQKKAMEEIYRVLKPGGIGLINLFKFSEISTLWFGKSFWDNHSLTEYITQYEFNENDYKEKDRYTLRVEAVSQEFHPITQNFFLQINK